ncbi:MAG: nucleoside triphosphate pyrophosphohydrolase [Thermodesulfobacteriota bacterium]|nr:nucleoside triphosphate pyrophosphohydrolase [Thermodesulfobacteriota bacterium]
MEEIIKLTNIVEKLRSPGGCPWDQKQTTKTLKPYILEEAYELIEAIDNGDISEIRDELGDLLLQVVFVAQIFSEQKKFNLADVATSISHKMIRRHPHVFADASRDEHALRWEEIKQQERLTQGKGNKLADRIPASLPALKRATKVAKKMGREDPSAQISQLQQYFSELSQLIEEPAPIQDEIKQTLGSIFFGTTQLSDSLDIDAEDLLRQKTIQVMTKIDR